MISAFVLSFTVMALDNHAIDDSPRNIGDSEVVNITAVYSSGATGYTMEFETTAQSPDTEYVVYAELDFPAGVEVVDATNMGDLPYNGETGDGEVISFGVESFGFGDPYIFNETVAFSVTVDIDGTFSGDLEIGWHLWGDVWGSPPHEVSGTMILEEVDAHTVTFNVEEDITADPIEGATISIAGVGDYVTDAAGVASMELFDDTYTANITASGYVSEEVTFTVDGEDKTVDVLMVDDIVQPFNLEVELVGLNEALFSWNEAMGWSEFFEDGVLPAGWDQIITNAAYTWEITGTVEFAESTMEPVEGDYQAFLMWDYGHQDEWLITPEFNAPADNLVFWYYGTNGSEHGDNYYVKASTDGGNTWDVLWNASDLPPGENHYDVPAVVDLSGYAGEEIKIAWNNVDGDGLGLWYAWAIDNISVGDMKIDVKDLVHVSKSEQKTGHNQAARDGKFLQPVNPEDMISSSKMSKAFLGFNVYLDGDLVAEEIAETEYLFTELPDNMEFTAGVRSVYTTGESEVSAIEFEVPGIPLANWALYITALLIGVFVFVRIRKFM